MVGDKDGPSDSRFEQGRGRVVEDKTTPSGLRFEQGRGGGWLGTKMAPPTRVLSEGGVGWWQQSKNYIKS